ncbi:MAG TPA: hypothetical protein VM913_09190 [Sphingomicrobium sp.]|jgi:hypothetical protein|nr:hypothetical protein [Sphingomicrobium sp.]
MIASVLMMLAAPGATSINPAATELFERDAVLNGWALAAHDGNGDGWLTTYEAQLAAAAFKDLADADRNGRVTVSEYEEAKRFIVARSGNPGPRVVVIR